MEIQKYHSPVMKIFLFAFLLVCSLSGYTQQTSRQLLATSGGNATIGSFDISYSIGDPVVDAVMVPGLIVTQGYQQPDTDSMFDNVVFVKAWLQGPYSNGIMNTNLAAQGYLPLSQPYNTAPWYYYGTETFSAIPANAVDWVLIELRTTIDTIVARKSGLLLSNGMITGSDAAIGLCFDQVEPGMYYIVVEHKNHLPIMTATKVGMPGLSMYNLTINPESQLFGGTQSAIGLGGGIYGLIAGDINKNLQLKYSGSNNDRSFIMQEIINATGSTSINSVANGYYRQDVDLNGQLKYSGSGNDPSLIIQNIVGLTGSTAITTVYTSPVTQGIIK